DADTVDRVVVMGDLHGDLGSLHKGLEYWNNRGVLVLLGDYADRGPHGVEVIETLLDLAERHPDQIVALKGNHEDYTPEGEPLFSPCTLIGEAAQKRGSWPAFFSTMQRLFERLALSALLPGASLFVHGGVCRELDSLQVLEEPGERETRELLWSDPGHEPGAYPSLRGAGSLFGPDVTAQVLEALGAGSIIRSHQPIKALHGPAVEHGGRVITVSTTQVYGGLPFILELDPSRYPSDEHSFQESAVFL
ncbi:MAG: metallophosphoesterase family protein, partial [Spirochaetota bacterium]